MKWFKHLSNAHRDNTLTAIFRKFGLEGEARFWRLIEILSEKYDNKGTEFTFDSETIRQSLRFRSAIDCRPFLDLLTTITEMKVDYYDNNVVIKYDKISEIKDNHARNLQVTDKRLASNLLLDKNRIEKRREDNNSALASKAPPSPLPPCETEKITQKKTDENFIAKAWNEFYNLPQVKKITDKRKKQIALTAKEFGFKSEEDWKNYFAQVSQSDFLTGQNDRGWKADFDFCINRNNVVKVLEGKYGTRQTQEELSEIEKEKILLQAIADKSDENAYYHDKLKDYRKEIELAHGILQPELTQEEIPW